jgi:hypothetical protein
VGSIFLDRLVVFILLLNIISFILIKIFKYLCSYLPPFSAQKETIMSSVMRRLSLNTVLKVFSTFYNNSLSSEWFDVRKVCHIKTSNRNWPIISSSLDGVRCSRTLLDPCNFAVNLVNTAMARRLQTAGLIVDEVTPFQLSDFADKDSTVVTQAIEVEKLRLEFFGGYIVESLVTFYVIDTEDTVDPEIIISNDL